MHVIILTTDANPTNPAAGQALRSATDTCERGRRVAYLIGAMTHQGSRRGVIADLPLDVAVVERALLMSFAQAFPGLEQDPETLAEIREQHEVAALYPVGSVIRPVIGAYKVYAPDAASVAAAGALVEQAARGLLDLAAGRWNHSLRPEGWR